MKADLSTFCIGPQESLRDAMISIDSSMKGIALVVDPHRRLLYTITDGDLRRAVLQGLDLNMTVESWSRLRKEHGNTCPVTAPEETPPSELLRRMQEEDLRHIPLVDSKGSVVGLAVLHELLAEEELGINAVIMAGGLGKRLYPLTKDLPKPMLPVGNRPLMEWTIQQLQKNGIRNVHVTTHYRADQIADYFQDGSNFGVNIRYVQENDPLGTAGALSLLENSDEPLLVINGDILTRVDFRAMIEFHRDHKAMMTVAVKHHEMKIPYGVIETEGVSVTGVLEKPVQRHFVSAGIYLLHPKTLQHIPKEKPFDMPELISKLLSKRKRVVCFPIREYWLDVGQPDDYQRALQNIHELE